MKIKNIVIIILTIIILILIVMIINLKKENNKELKTGNSSQISYEQNLQEFETDEIDKRHDKALTQIVDYEDNIIQNSLTKEEKETLEKLRNELKNRENLQENNTDKMQEYKEKYREYYNKYITGSEKKKIDEYQEKLDKMEEKYNEYIEIKFDIRENGTTTQKEARLEKLREELAKELDNLGEIK